MEMSEKQLTLSEKSSRMPPSHQWNLKMPRRMLKPPLVLKTQKQTASLRTLPPECSQERLPPVNAPSLSLLQHKDLWISLLFPPLLSRKSRTPLGKGIPNGYRGIIQTTSLPLGTSLARTVPPRKPSPQVRPPVVLLIRPPGPLPLPVKASVKSPSPLRPVDLGQKFSRRP